MSHPLLPAKICATKHSFTYDSLIGRIPNIVTKIIDQMTRFYHEAVKLYGEDGGEKLNNVVGSLSRMRYQMMTNKPLEPFPEDFPSSVLWNTLLDEVNNYANDVKQFKEEREECQTKATWFNAPFLFVECYMYNRISGYFHVSQVLREYDYFRSEKERAYSDSINHMLAIGTELLHLIESERLEPIAIRQALQRFVQIALWGNKCDLSLSGGDPHEMSGIIFHELEEFRPNILADDVDEAVDNFLLRLPVKNSQRRLDIVLDNAGLEVFVDLCLADFIIAKSLADKVVFHGKAIPWFVSDVTHHDMKWVLEKLSTNSDLVLANLGNRWTEHFKRGIFEFEADSFWTQSFVYCEMAQRAPQLFSQLSNSSFIVFKGDLNYRKLTGDRWWPHQTPFRIALNGFEPAPLLALRTLKAETVVGLSVTAIERISSLFSPNDTTWMYSSDYAVVQLFPSHLNVTTTEETNGNSK